MSNIVRSTRSAAFCTTRSCTSVRTTGRFPAPDVFLTHTTRSPPGRYVSVAIARPSTRHIAHNSSASSTWSRSRFGPGAFGPPARSAAAASKSTLGPATSRMTSPADF
jgi:hypothetical protein